MANLPGPIRDLGPCCLIWDPAGVNLDLKPTFGSCTFRSEDNSEDVMEDEHGVAPVDAVFTGRVATFEAPITRPNLLQLEEIIHDSVKRKTGGKYKILDVPNPVGDNMKPIAKELIVKPVIDRVCSATTSEWLHLLACYPIASLEIGYDLTDQRVYNVTFKCFPSIDSGTVGLIWRFGPAS